MKPGDQIRLLVDVNRGAESFKRGDTLTLRHFVGDDPEPLWAVHETNVGFYETEMELELYGGASSLINRKANGDEELIVTKGDRIIVKTGDYQGQLGVVKVWNGVGLLTITAEDNNMLFTVPYENVRIWTEKDDDIRWKFKKLFALINTNIASLKIKDKSNFIAAETDKHLDALNTVRHLYHRFLYLAEFTKKDIRELNNIWRIQKKCVAFYLDPKWVYDGNIPTGYTSTRDPIEYSTLMNYQPSGMAHAVIHSMSST